MLSGMIVKKYRMMTRLKLLTSRKILTVPKRNSDSGKNTAEKKLKKLVVEFFEKDENSRMCPGKKDAITRKGVKKQRRLLADSLKNLHKKFVALYPADDISYTTFCRFRPFWVLKPDYRSRDTCLCMTHANFELLVTKAHSLKMIKHSNSTDVVKLMTCCEDGQKFNRECLERTCSACKDKRCPWVIIGEDLPITFHQWTNKKTEIPSSGNDERGKKYTKICLKDVTTVQNSAEFVDFFEEYLEKKMMPHMANHFHQLTSVANVKSSLGDNDILIHCDFSENYKCKYGSEVQSVHFGGSRSQISLHTVMVYHKEGDRIVGKGFCTLSEDLRHGPSAITAHLKPVISWIKESKKTIHKVHFLSDGPTTQYRNKNMFYLAVSVLAKELGIGSVSWHFSEKGHGKGAVDGIGGCLKRTADNLVGYGADIQNLNELQE